ncbi:MAG: IS200/IS605 family transposase [Cyanobacteriota bacterium]
MQPRKGSHSVFSIRLHYVFVTKYRRKVINSELMDTLREAFLRVCLATQCELIEFSGEADHVHLLLDVHPDNKISQLASSFKSASSRMVRRKHSDYLSRFYKGSAFWSGSYYVASSGGAPVERLKEYIRNHAPHRP